MVVSITRVLFALFLLFYTTAVGLRTPFIAIRRFQRSPLISATHSEEISSSIIEKWVTEEQELLKHEEFEKQRQLTESDEQRILSLPKYMQDILNTLDDEPPCLPSKLPVIVVMGRPNTGKSTIFNRISESFKEGSIVHDEPGITRDRTYRLATWGGYNFQIVDTGGIVFDDRSDVFAEQITHQALVALEDAHAGILVCDGQIGISPLDQSLAAWLRRHARVPIYLAVNKCESTRQETLQIEDFWSLGLGQPYPVSGIHGNGMGDLLDAVVQKLPKVTSVQHENTTNVALVGRPNVGKSSLFNRLYGKERVIVSDVAGTTRDAVDEVIYRDGQAYRLIDTAGIRKKGKVHYGPEFFMVNRAFKAIRRSEVVVLLIDAIQGIVDQDRIIAERIAEEGRACVLVLNKWDAVPNKDDKSYDKAIEHARTVLPVVRWAEVVVLSALTGQRTEKLLACVDRAAKQFQRRVSTSVLNEVIKDATMWMTPPTITGRMGRVYYAIQVSTRPPTIVLFVNDPDLFPESYRRFMEKKIRESFGFEGTPIRLIWRGKTLRQINRSAKHGELGRIVGEAMKR